MESKERTVLKSMEEILKETYEHHRTVVNPDENWAEWEECLTDGTAKLVYEAMSKWANQCTIGLSQRLDYQINQGWRQHEEIEALKHEIERLKQVAKEAFNSFYMRGFPHNEPTWEQFKAKNNL